MKNELLNEHVNMDVDQLIFSNLRSKGKKD